MRSYPLVELVRCNGHLATWQLSEVKLRRGMIDDVDALGLKVLCPERICLFQEPWGTDDSQATSFAFTQRLYGSDTGYYYGGTARSLFQPIFQRSVSIGTKKVAATSECINDGVDRRFRQ